MKNIRTVNSGHVFISYSREDRTIADAIVDDFEQHGIKCWYAPRDIMPGKSFMSIITQAIKSCWCFVLVYTEASNNSKYVINEVKRAFDEEKTIIPFCLTEMEMNDDLKFLLTRVHRMDALTSPLSQKISTLRDVVLKVYPISVIDERLEQETDEHPNLNDDYTEKSKSYWQEGVVTDNKDFSTKNKAILPSKGTARIKRPLLKILKKYFTEKKSVIIKCVLAIVVIVIAIVANSFWKAEIQYQLGNTFYNGTLVIQDYDKAAECFALSAEQGYAPAQNRLGDCYYYGSGVEKNYNKAVEWYSKAAEQGYDVAQFHLGYCYDSGTGVEQDFKKAVEWYSRAAEQSNVSAQLFLGFCYGNGIGVERDYIKAAEWFTKAAEKDLDQAQFHLGYYYYVGLGVEQDYTKAVEWFSKSAEQGFADAQYFIGLCYEDGSGVEQDYEKAVEWFSKSAEQGYVDAQFQLGQCYETGLGVNQDYTKAVMWYSKAAKQGHEESKQKLIDYIQKT